MNQLIDSMIAPNPHAKFWLFDFDNTLAALEREVDWAGSRRALEAYLRAEGVDGGIFAEIPKGNLPLYSALHSRWLRASLDPPHIAMPPLVIAEAILQRASEIIERHELIGAERAAPTPGAIDLLKTITARAAIAIIVTSNSSLTVARWLDLHRIGNLVRAIVGRDSLLALKPSPEMIVHAFALAATLPAAAHIMAPDNDGPASASYPESPARLTVADVVFVGDSEADFGAARAAGVGFYGIATSQSARQRLITAGAADVFASPRALQIHLMDLTPT